jgi:23S rRNA (guanosine2251-2'-O)-methyltransferase
MSPAFVYGIHAVSSRLQQSPRHCRRLFCADKRNPRLLQLIDQARKAGIEVSIESRAQLSIVATEPLASFEDTLAAINDQSLLLVLDGVQDPHNLGACLRTADACGVDAVIIPKDRSVKMNATVRKVAAGGAETVALIEVTNLARCLKDLKQAGVWIYGTGDSASGSLYEHDFRGPVALVMGAEGAGLRRLTMESCDHLVSLPMLGQVESLNVSVATGVCLYEILRSRSSVKT